MSIRLIFSVDFIFLKDTRELMTAETEVSRHRHVVCRNIQHLRDELHATSHTLALMRAELGHVQDERRDLPDGGPE